MTDAVDRASMLMAQNRTELAENELRRGLSEEPDDALLHAMLGLCIARDEDRLGDATSETQKAIMLAPDMPFVHYAHSFVMRARNRFDEAGEAIQEAIRLDPYDARYFGQFAAIQFALRDWRGALEAADAGLAIDPEYSACLSYRAIALERLGRGQEAIDAAKATVKTDPDDSGAHTAFGWTALHAGRHEDAKVAFREALRLDPSNDIAREGMISAINSKNFLFRWIQRAEMALGRLSHGNQFAFIFGLWFGIQLLAQVGARVPVVEPFVVPLIMIYATLIVLSWVISPLFNAALRFHPFGKHLLRSADIWQSNLIATCFVCGVIGAAYALHKMDLLAGLTVGFYWMLMCRAVSLPFGMPTRGRMLCFAAAGILVAAVPVIGVLKSLNESSAEPFGVAMQIFSWSLLGLQVAGNFAIVAPNRR